MAKYVYTTLASPHAYTFYKPGPGGRPIISHSVHIKGGGGVAELSGSGRNIITPLGVRTEVNDDDFAMLMTHPVFKRHLSRGHITVDERKTNANSVARNHLKKDTSAPKTPDDYKPQDPRKIEDTINARKIPMPAYGG